MAHDRVRIKITNMPDFGGSDHNLYCGVEANFCVALLTGLSNANVK